LKLNEVQPQLALNIGIIIKTGLNVMVALDTALYKIIEKQHNCLVNKYCTLYIVRHGETKGNVKRQIQGHTDTPLTKKGIRQAQETAKKLKDIAFDAIFSSDIGRAKITAEIVRMERKLAIKTSELLRERNYGVYSKQKYETLDKDLDKYVEELNIQSGEQKWKSKFPKIESNAEVVTRFIRFLRETAIAYPKKTVLVATHGGLMENFLIHLGAWNYSDHHVKHVGNAGYLKLRSDGIDFFIEGAEDIELAI
jgi:alpha-ribazole phosphatase